MESSNHLAQQLQKAFGHTDLYKVLDVAKTASASEVKKAYMKQALKHHPDKGGDAEKFQALSAAFTILSDTERRKEYDQNGLIDVEDMLNSDEMSESFQFWFDYFRNLTPKVTTASIDDFAKTYIGSAEEEGDLVSAYENYQGDMKKIMEVVMFAEEGSEQRIINTLEQLIQGKKIKKTKKFTESCQKILSTAQNAKKSSKKRKSEEGKEEEGDEAQALALMIAQKHKNRAAGIASILAKYGDEEQEGEEEISEEDFLKAQRRVVKDAKGGKEVKKVKKQKK